MTGTTRGSAAATTPATASRVSAPIVGREAELALVDGLLSGDARALLLTGEPGIGKTRIWEAGVAAARERGLRVLTARPSDAEARLSFAALIDLLDGVSSDELADLPAPQLQALDVALVRAAPTGPAPGEHAIAVGLLSALRALSAGGPLLVAIDDVQWLDRPSAEALAFAARRLDGAAVGFLVATRPTDPSALELALEQIGLQRRALTPLSVGAIRRMLSERLELSLPRQLLRRIVDTTLGNPLFALEVGRSLAESGPPEIGAEIPLPDTIESLLGTRVARLPGSVRRVLLAVALSANPRLSQLAAIGGSSAVDDAVGAGVLVVEDGRVRASHPLLAAAARKHSSRRERRELHLALAETVADDELRALHLALATDDPDAGLAAAVSAAAASASARGAAREAVVLAEHGLRLTPPAFAERPGRLLGLVRYLEIAGERQRLTDVLAPELDALPPGEPRVRASLLLAAGVVADNDEIRRHLLEALAAADGDPALQALVLGPIAENDAVIRVQGIAAAEASALEALSTGGAGEQQALYALAWARALRGHPIDEVCERFRATSEAASYMAESPERVAGQRLVWRGEVGPARALLGDLLAVADERGESYSYVLQRLHVCQLELRIGDCDAAARVLDEWAEASDRVLWPMYERCQALLAAARGRPEDARRWGAEAVAAAEATGSRWDWLEAQRALGVAALLAHAPAEAEPSLRAVWEHTHREGVDEPGVFPVAPDLVEALLELDRPQEALEITARLREPAEQQEHPWGLATARRCDALVRLVTSGYDAEAAGELERAAESYGELGLRFDRARALLDLGRAQRRFKKWGRARETLELAATAFDELGSHGWAGEARSELARVSARPPRSAGQLTPAERRVAELASEGLANKEIAGRLFVTVNTVEFHLRNVYAKLSVRSRAQLADRLAGPPLDREP